MTFSQKLANLLKNPKKSSLIFFSIHTSQILSLKHKNLGAIASYATAKDVPFVRVIFCDAHAYDAGYMRPEDMTGKVKVTGGGGTVLQPAVTLLEQAKDFPQDGPILIITDGFIEDRLKIWHEHAFLLPKGNKLPFRAKGEVFYFKE